MASFREAEEASKAEGIPQATVDWALQNATKNPTSENIAIAKDTYAAQQALINAAAGKAPAGTLVSTVTIGGAPAGYRPETQVSPSTKIVDDYMSAIKDAEAAASDVSKTLADITQQTADVEAAGQAAGIIAESMGGSPWSPIKPPTPISTSDAVFAALVAQMSIYGINNLADTVARIRRENPGITGDELLLLLRNDTRYNTEYLNRFSGNKGLIAAGKAPLDEKTYLANEQAYEKLFKGYNLTQFMNRDKYAMLISNEVSPTEAGSRVSLAYDRVLGDPSTADVFKRYYPGLTTSDIVATLLDPKEQLPQLQKKVTASEIGGAALRQGLDIAQAASTIQSERYKNLTQGTVGYETLQGLGVTKEEALTGYQNIAAKLPRAEFLSSITGGADYTQVQAEQEEFMGLASAKRARQDLSAIETGRFGAKSGRYQAKDTSRGIL
jgi:hypothetical protein